MKPQRNAEYDRLFDSDGKPRSGADLATPLLEALQGRPMARPPSQDFERVVATLERHNGALVVRAKTYKNAPFVDVRFFMKGTDGELHPTGKGCSIRVSEAGDVCRAIQDAVDVLVNYEVQG